MAYIEPNTTVQFLNVPWDVDYENTMYFEGLPAQESYMSARVIRTIGSNSYQRKNKGVIRVGWTADLETPRNSVIHELYKSNYMRFKNTNFENKWFYAFVTKVEYVNNNTCDVFYDIDVLQTWHFDYHLLECFIERNHTLTDQVGEHTVPEGLEHGEYFDTALAVSSGTQSGNVKYEYTPAVCLITTFDDEGEYVDGGVIKGRFTQGNLYSGLYYTVYRLASASDLESINETLKAISAGAEVISQSGVKIPRFLADGVVAIFMLPWEFATGISGGSAVPAQLISFDIQTNNLYKLGNYTPRNKKLMCYPYNMIYISNNVGGSAEYRWEDFNNPFACQFNIWGNVNPNGGLYIAPAGYKGYAGENDDELLQVNGFPMCAWSYDAFKAWVAQNAGTITAIGAGLVGKWAEIIATGGAGALLGAGGQPTPYMGTVGSYQGQHLPQGVSNMNPTTPYTPNFVGGGGISGALAGTFGAIGQLYDHSRRPPQAAGNNNASLMFQAGLLTFFYYRKHIKEEYAKIIDSYFDMYGYKLNTVGVPTRTARPCYNYVKTIGCAIDGDIPAEDAKAIQAIYDRGIRFWKPTATFGSYDPTVNPNQVVVAG